MVLPKATCWGLRALGWVDLSKSHLGWSGDLQTKLHKASAYFMSFKTNSVIRAGSLVKSLWEMARVQEVVSSNPSTRYWMDFFHIDLL